MDQTLKTFRARTTKEALANVCRTLGPDAIIARRRVESGQGAQSVCIDALQRNNSVAATAPWSPLRLIVALNAGALLVLLVFFLIPFVFSGTPSGASREVIRKSWVLTILPPAHSGQTQKHETAIDAVDATGRDAPPEESVFIEDQTGEKRRQTIESVIGDEAGGTQVAANISVVVEALREELLWRLSYNHGIRIQDQEVLSRRPEALIYYPEVDDQFQFAEMSFNITGDALHLDIQPAGVPDQPLFEHTLPLSELINRDASAIAEEVTARIAAAMELSEGRRTPGPRLSDNPEAAQQYLLGQYQMKQLDQERYSKALNNFEQAIKLDPEFASALAAAAEVRLAMARRQLDVSEQVVPMAKDYIDRALSLQPGNVDALVAQAYLHEFMQQYSLAARELRAAIMINPSLALARVRLADLLLIFGNMDEAILHAEQAVLLDPMSVRARGVLVEAYFFDERYDLVNEQMDILFDLHNDNKIVASYMYWFSIWLGHDDRVLPLIRDIFAQYDEFDKISVMEQKYEEGGLAGVMRYLLETFPYDAGTRQAIFTYLGEVDRAVTELEKMFENGRYIAILKSRNHPAYESLWSNNRYRVLVRKTINALE